MPFREFSKTDLFYNRIKTFPKSEFVIYDSKIYHNAFTNHAGPLSKKLGVTTNIHGTKQGFISLFELNVDRVIDNGGSNPPPAGKSIYPFITKDGARIAFKTVSTSEFDSSDQFKYGDIVKSKYPLTASIKRTRFVGAASTITTVNNSERFQGSFKKTTGNKRFINALKNTFNEYVYLSEHYKFDRPGHWNKGTKELSLLEIPSIFYGSSIRKGSVDLQTYISGVLASECRDIRKNGELVQVTGTYNAATHNNKVAGVILYNEGFIAMTGSWDITDGAVQDQYYSGDTTARWVDFAAGARDGINAGTLENTLYRLVFEGVNYVPTVTMLAHAPKGEFNNSTNPTAFVKSDLRNAITGSKIYREYPDLKFSKLEHGDYVQTGSFKKQTYISKIGIYDSQKRLIGIANLANPVRKTEEREYTFKLKMDF